MEPCQYRQGGAPLAYAPLDSYRSNVVLPDLDVLRAGQRFFVEVKTKSQAVLLRSENEYRHGIEQETFDHYVHAQRQLGVPIWLFIYEQSTGKVFVRSVAWMERNAIKGTGGKEKTPFVYWRRDHLLAWERVKPSPPTVEATERWEPLKALPKPGIPQPERHQQLDLFGGKQ